MCVRPNLGQKDLRTGTGAYPMHKWGSRTNGPQGIWGNRGSGSQHVLINLTEMC